MTAFDEVMLADLREWRRRIEGRDTTPPDIVSLTMPELDALLEAVAERDVLNREACAMPDEGRSFRLAPVVAIVNGRPLVEAPKGREAKISGEFVTMRVDEWRRVTDELTRLRTSEATAIDAAVEEDERVIAWDAIAAHPFFRECYGTKASLLDAMLAKLTASTFTADIPDEIRERAGERRTVNCRCSVTPILHGHPAEDEVSIEISAEIPRAGSTALGIPYERPKLRDVIADALGEGACS